MLTSSDRQLLLRVEKKLDVLLDRQAQVMRHMNAPVMPAYMSMEQLCPLCSHLVEYNIDQESGDRTRRCGCEPPR